MDKSIKKIIRKIIAITIAIVAVVLLVDYFNICGIIGMRISNFNADYISLIIGNIVVISLFIATYYIVDSHGLKKEKNKRYTALIILKNTYIACQDAIAFFDNKENRIKIAQKCNFDKVIHEEPTFLYFQNSPFNQREAILNFSIEGIIEPEEYDTYLKIQNQYKDYISFAISLYDSYAVALLTRNPLKTKLQEALQHIFVEIENDNK